MRRTAYTFAFLLFACQLLPAVDPPPKDAPALPSQSNTNELTPIWNERIKLLQELQQFEQQAQADTELKKISEQIVKLQSLFAQRTQILLEAQAGYVQKHELLLQLEQKLGIRPSNDSITKNPPHSVPNTRAQAPPEIPPPIEIAPKAQEANDF